MFNSSNDVFLQPSMPFGVVDIAAYLGGQAPKTAIFGSWIGIFKPNVLLLLLQLFYGPLSGGPLIFFVDGPNSCPTNPTWWTAAILKKSMKCHMSTTVWPIFTKVGRDDASGLSEPYCPLKILTFRNPRWRTPTNLKFEEITISQNRLTDYEDIWHGDASRSWRLSANNNI